MKLAPHVRHVDVAWVCVGDGVLGFIAVSELADMEALKGVHGDIGERDTAKDEYSGEDCGVSHDVLLQWVALLNTPEAGLSKTLDTPVDDIDSVVLALAFGSVAERLSKDF